MSPACGARYNSAAHMRHVGDKVGREREETVSNELSNPSPVLLTALPNSLHETCTMCRNTLVCGRKLNVLWSYSPC